MRIALLAGTRRGLRFLQRFHDLVSHADLVVFSFREEPEEPPFLDAIREAALAYGAQFFEGRRAGRDRFRQVWELDVDLLFAVNWRYVVPASVYRRARLGSFVFHDSLLPAYRGFSPTVWAILNGENHTGVTLCEMTEEIDAGDIIDQMRVPIGPRDAIGIVTDRVTEAYLTLLERSLAKLLDGSAPRRQQDHASATYTCKRRPDDNRIDWSAPSSDVYNLIRAVSEPYPGAFTTLETAVLRVWDAEPVARARRYVGRVPGRVVEVRPGVGSAVMTGDGLLLLTRVQLEGHEKVCASDVLDGLNLTLGR